MIMRRPSSRTATRRDHLAEGTPNAQVTTAEVKEQAEVQLFYKAKDPRPKDETDFAAALPVLDPSQRLWLSEGLALVYGQQHPWWAPLQGAGQA